MKTNTIKDFVLYLSAAAIIVGYISLLLIQTHDVKASAGALPATIASSTLAVVPSNTAIVLFSTSTCSSRIISTPATTTLMLTFSDAQTPTGVFGIYQAASTTKEYDSATYGCGQVRGLSNAASVVTLIDSR